MLELWEATLAAIDHPLLTSRYQDLLWVAEDRRPNPSHKRYQHGRGAIDAYLQLAATASDRFLTATHSLERALELSTLLNDNAGAARIAATMVARGRRPDRRAGHPGAPIELLTAVMLAPRKAWPPELRATLERAETIPQEPPSLADQVADMLATLTEGDERTQIRQRQLARWDRWIERTKGLQRQLFLRRLLELATRVLPQAAHGYLLALQALDPAEFEYGTYSAELKMPPEDVERHLEWLVGEDGWAGLFARDLAMGPPTGKADAHAALATQLREIAPLSFRIGRVVSDEAGRILREERTDTERIDGQLRSQETLWMTGHGRFLAIAVERAIGLYGRPIEDLLASLVAGPVIRAEVAADVAHAIAHYFAADYDACIHSLAPKLERVIRDLAMAAGLVVIKLPDGEHGGGVRSIGLILADLRAVLPEDWWRYLWDLLVDDRSLNVRNRAAHGLIVQATQVEAVLLVHAAMLLARATASSVPQA